MIEFRQKCFTEYDALRTLYTRITRDFNWKNRIKIIEKNALLPVLGGNNIVIERFVISHTFFGKDKYRMYLRLGAKVKLPDGVRLPGYNVSDRVAGVSLNFNGSLFEKKLPQKSNLNKDREQGEQRNNSQIETEQGLEQREFVKNKNKGNNNNNNNNNDGSKFMTTSIHPNNIDLTVEKTIPAGDVVKYEKKERLLVLEFTNVDKALEALDKLPFGVNYNLFLLV